MRGRLLLLFVILLGIGLLPATALAQSPDAKEPYDTHVRVNGPVSVPAGEIAQGVVVINDSATIAGTVD